MISSRGFGKAFLFFVTVLWGALVFLGFKNKDKVRKEIDEFFARSKSFKRKFKDP